MPPLAPSLPEHIRSALQIHWHPQVRCISLTLLKGVTTNGFTLGTGRSNIMKTTVHIVIFLVATCALGVYGWSQSNSTPSPNPTPAKTQDSAGRSTNKTGSGKEMEKGGEDIGKGAAKGTGDMAKGTAGAVGNLAHGNLSGAGASLGKGAGGLGKNVAVGSGKGFGKIGKGLGGEFKKIGGKPKRHGEKGGN